ncbi:MAG: hypothetical protein HOI11_19335 [Gammaproteobacteria bacterium]|nr:hypothetical protein [Gammaproteobacteria bacterium]
MLPGTIFTINGNHNDQTCLPRHWRVRRYRLAYALTPLMEAHGHRIIMVTSATSAVGGNRGQRSHAAAMVGRRILCQSLNAEFSPKGIHVPHILIDGALDAPDTLGKILGVERFKELRESRGGEHYNLMLPENVVALRALIRAHPQT